MLSSFLGLRVGNMQTVSFLLTGSLARTFRFGQPRRTLTGSALPFLGNVQTASESKGKFNILRCKAALEQSSRAYVTESRKFATRRKLTYYISFSSQMTKCELQTVTTVNIWAFCKVLHWMLYANPSISFLQPA